MCELDPVPPQSSIPVVAIPDIPCATMCHLVEVSHALAAIALGNEDRLIDRLQPSICILSIRRDWRSCYLTSLRHGESPRFPRGGEAAMRPRYVRADSVKDVHRTSYIVHRTSLHISVHHTPSYISTRDRKQNQWRLPFPTTLATSHDSDELPLQVPVLR
jgi:hypothetical protein